mgnify:CR=1 FL=1
MNIFFIGMGYMGQERFKAIINIKKFTNLNILGFYDPKVKKIKKGNYVFETEKNLDESFFKKKKIDL